MEEHGNKSEGGKDRPRNGEKDGSGRKYNWKEIEPKWQKQWKDLNLWNFDFADTEKPVFSIDTPPPYASGALHMGRATAYTLIDFVGRYRRMRGYNVFFPLCVDVNGTPIEINVEKKFNITKKSIDRHEYIRMCSEFANDNISKMMHEFEILGESMDPSLFYRTDSKDYRRITQVSFIRLYHRGLIYKGEAPVNWCPRCTTALADAEVEYKTRKTLLNYIKFQIEGRSDSVVIATTRPELLCTCQLIAVNPNDDSKGSLAGVRVLTPVFGKSVEIFEDEKVDPAFGTGIVMICTIGDKDDLEWVYKYSLPLEKGIDEEGKMTQVAGGYAGLPVAEARTRIIEDLKAQGLLVKQEETEQNVGTCWRCHSPIEFLQMKQWFLKTRDFKEDMLRLTDELNWHPDFMKVRLKDWINSLQWDWVLSRQRYFATPIPVWECMACGQAVPAGEEQCYVDPTRDKPPADKCPKCGGELKGCPDVFDTWMDSSISPLYNTFWLRDDAKFTRLYPMTLRPQAHDIIRTWAYYTILRCHIITGKKPWSDIMIHGFIMAPDGKPMHTSLGNAIDPLPVLEEFGADAFRYYAATTSLGEDHAFIRKEVVHGNRLATKFWNVQNFIGSYLQQHRARLLEMAQAAGDGNSPVPGSKMLRMPGALKPADRWILGKYSRMIESLTEKMDNYLFDQALKEIESFIWHELADHYIEMVKWRLRGDADESALFTLATLGLGTAKLIAPIMPHIAEEVFHRFYPDMDDSRSIHTSAWVEPVIAEDEAEKTGECAKQVISTVRTWKSSSGMPLNAQIASVTIVGNPGAVAGFEDDIRNTTRAGELLFTDKSEIEETIVAVKPVYSRLGPRLKGTAKEAIIRLLNITPSELAIKLRKDGFIDLAMADNASVRIERDDLEFERIFISRGHEVTNLQAGELLVLVQK
jgi:valyl-tRNA synthetase